MSSKQWSFFLPNLIKIFNKSFRLCNKIFIRNGTKEKKSFVIGMKGDSLGKVFRWGGVVLNVFNFIIRLFVGYFLAAFTVSPQHPFKLGCFSPMDTVPQHCLAFLCSLLLEMVTGMISLPHLFTFSPMPTLAYTGCEIRVRTLKLRGLVSTPTLEILCNTFDCSTLADNLYNGELEWDNMHLDL